MKKYIVLFIFIAVVLSNNQAQQISFSFSADYMCNPVDLDSIYVENLSQGGDTTLYYPDLTLTFSFSNIDLVKSDQNKFNLIQNYPNPFTSQTNIDIFVPEKDVFTINVYDYLGRKITTCEKFLDKGYHNFTYFGGTSNKYILTVKSNNYFEKLKLMQIDNSNNYYPMIVYNGSFKSFSSQNPDYYELKSFKTAFPYDIGNQLRFTGYYENNFSVIVVSPTQSMEYFFDISNNVPSAPTSAAHSASQGQIIWNWNVVSEATGYKYNTVNNYNTAINNGTSTSHTQEGLTCETAYTLYVWAYNSCGESSVLTLTQTTEECPFICGDQVSYNGYSYSTVEIGTQCWFAENLKTTQFRNGQTIANVTTNSEWSNLSTPAWCHYQNNSGYDASYGKLYNWFAVDDSRGLCPEGWHVPTDAEWTALTTHLGGASVAGGKLKETGTTHWNSPNTGATNSSGFTARGGAARYADGTWTNHPQIPNIIKYGGGWWTSTQFGTSQAYWRGMAFNIQSIERNPYDRKFGYSVRCIKN